MMGHVTLDGCDERYTGFATEFILVLQSAVGTVNSVRQELVHDHR